MGGKAIVPSLVSYLSARPNSPVTLEQLAQAIGMEQDKCRRALTNAINGGVFGTSLRVVHRGQVWMWQGDGGEARPAAATPLPIAPKPGPVTAPTAPPTQGLGKGDVVEVMGVTREGDAVASDENGRLYRVVPL